MLNNINKNNYIKLTSNRNDALGAEVEKWMIDHPRCFQKWASPFGQLECECKSIGFSDDEMEEHDTEREILVACWCPNGRFYKGEIWNNAPDIVIEHSECDDDLDPETFYFDWRIYVHKEYIQGEENTERRNLVLAAKLIADHHPSDEHEILDRIFWGN